MLLSQQQINAINTYMQTKPVLAAYLFGSYVRGEAKKDSDIDILVELDHQKPVGLQFIQMQIDLEHLLHNKVDLISYSGLSPYIKPIVDQEKKLIYERQVGR